MLTGLSALQVERACDVGRATAGVLAEIAAVHLRRRRSSATEPARCAGCSSGPRPTQRPGSGNRQSTQPDIEHCGAVGYRRGRPVVRDVAGASAAVSWRRARRLDRIAGRRAKHLHLAVQLAHLRFPRGLDVCARRQASPAAWCCRTESGGEAAESSRNCPAMIAGMHAADEISAGAGCPANPRIFRSRSME